MRNNNIFKHYKLYLFALAIILFFLYLSWKYIDIVQNKRDALKESNYKSQASIMNEKLDSMILSKQKATVAIAITIANDSALPNDILDGDIDENYYTNLIFKYKSNTLYKNIWIEILDKDLNSLYRSWSKRDIEKLTQNRSDMIKVIQTKKPIYSVSSDRYDLSIKAIIPVLKDGIVVGILEVISHFNSISKIMKKSDIYSVVVLEKNNTKELTYPFTNIFIDEYYIANFDASLALRNHLKNNGIENYFKDFYTLEDEYLIVSSVLKTIDNQIVGYYIMFKKLRDIPNAGLEYFMFKWIAIGVIFLMLIAVLISSFLFFANRKQKNYYKSIIDSSTNIVIIYNSEGIVGVNEIFFKYFNDCKSIKDFNKKHRCISEFFDREDGYLQAQMDGIHWIEYLIKHIKEENKVKIINHEKEYYFSVTASLVSKEDNYYSIVFSNITKQEKYKKELELMTITDPLSKINNRRYFQQKMEDEISRVKRYKYPLSLIIFDIDFFKKINDKYGHNVGDKVIIEYCKFVSSMLREEDSFCRIGGEEFIIILPHIDRGKAYKVAEKLRTSIELHKKVVPITMSFGVVEYIMGEESDYMFKRADQALYKAKESGRNRVKIG